MIQDLLLQMWEGNIVAWLAFALAIVALGLVVLLGILWWKMPEPAKKLFWNNLIGHRPIIANAYDNKVLRFETPRIFREGVLYDKKSGWHFVPRLTKDADGMLNVTEQELVNKTFNIQGASGQFYVAYSGKGTIINPELQSVLEHSQLYEKSGNPVADGVVRVDKKMLINALQNMKDEAVMIRPVWITTLLDPRKIKNYMSKAYSKSQLLAQEIEIMDSVREQFQGSMIKMLVVLNVITLVGIVVMAAKLFGMF